MLDSILTDEALRDCAELVSQNAEPHRHVYLAVVAQTDGVYHLEVEVTPAAISGVLDTDSTDVTAARAAAERLAHTLTTFGLTVVPTRDAWEALGG